MLAKQLGSAVYLFVAVAVKHQKAIIAADPSDTGTNTVAVVVEHNAAVSGHGFDAVAVQIQRQGVVVTANFCQRTWRRHSKFGVFAAVAELGAVVVIITAVLKNATIVWVGKRLKGD